MTQFAAARERTGKAKKTPPEAGFEQRFELLFSKIKTKCCFYLTYLIEHLASEKVPHTEGSFAPVPILPPAYAPVGSPP